MSEAAPTRRRRIARPRGPVRTAVVFTAVVAVLSGAAFSPIYQHPRIWLVTAVGAGTALGVLWLGRRWRPGITLLALVGAFALVVLPAAVPRAFQGGIAGLARAEALALAEVVHGWKHILTLTLPLGTYQNVMVPALAATTAATAIGVALILHGGRLKFLAALPALLPALGATFLGSSTVSEPARFGPVTLTAPRETALWVCTIAVVAIWISVVSGAEHRAALRRGRDDDDRANAAIRRGALVRVVAAGVILAVAAGGAMLIAPALDPEARRVPRDRIDPEVVAREQVSPLASYRRWKQDDAYHAPLFTVFGDRLPPALRLAVLDHFDGVDFTVGPSSEIGRFARMPSARTNGTTAPVRIRIESGYDDVWVPLAELGSPPEFFGERAAELDDAFFLNRELGAGLAVPTARGLHAGDGFEALMRVDPEPVLTAGPLHDTPLVDTAQYPRLEQWLDLQDLPPGPAGLTTAVERLRERGYLSHSIAESDGGSAWLADLAERTPVRFIPSAGGHGASRIEELFDQLVEQQLLAPAQASGEDLVAGIGDDEQFATAAALLARALGYDSRVVLGVRLGGQGDAQAPIPTCEDRCEGRHVTAWVEVRGDDHEWIPLQVTPQVAIPPTLTQRGEQYPEHPTHVEERDAVEADPPAGETDREGGTDQEPEEQPEPISPVLRSTLLVVAAAVLMVLPWLVLPVVKRIRRWRRRRRRAPELSVLSAWHELTDAYLDAGHPIPAGASRSDVAAELGLQDAETITAHVDRAVFAPEGVDEEQAQESWRIVTAEIARHRSRAGLWRRVRGTYSLRSLGVGRSRRHRRGG